MDTPTPSLRKPGIIHRLLVIAEKHADKRGCQGPHCECSHRTRIKVWVLFWLFLLALGAVVRREVLSYVPPLHPAEEPKHSGYVLPGTGDGAKP